MPEQRPDRRQDAAGIRCTPCEGKYSRDCKSLHFFARYGGLLGGEFTPKEIFFSFCVRNREEEISRVVTPVGVKLAPHAANVAAEGTCSP